jgi:hypothetical protein
MSSDDCARCHHARACHVQSLFGKLCEGRDWHYSSSDKCACTGFVEPQQIAGHKGGTRFPGARRSEREQEG